MRRGVVRAQRKPCPLPALRRWRRKPDPLPALRPNVPDVAACGGGGLFGAVRWRGAGCRRKRSGLARGWAGVRTRPRPMLPLPCPPTPHRRGEGRGTRPALLLCYHSKTNLR